MRLVGFFEYVMALRNFDTLLGMLSPAELAAVDAMVGEKPQFAVQTNLSKSVQLAPSSLTTPAFVGESMASGLAPVIALARIEVSAMLAAFTDVSKPFESLRPGEFEKAAYQEMVLDGARSHYWGLVGDPMLRKVVRMSPQNKEVLSYSRRLVLARAFLHAATKANLERFSPLELRELSSWTEGLNTLQQGFYRKMQQFLAGITQTTISGDSFQSEYLNACGALLRAEQRELKRGTAKVTNF